MHWLGLAKPDSEYFGGQDLPSLDAKITVTIKAYDVEVIRTQKGEIKKGVLHFEEKIKPWIVSKDKLTPIKNEYGIETDKWIGKKITLFFDPTIKFGREITGGVRAEIPRNLPLPKCEQCGKDITAAGKMTPEQVAAFRKSKYGKALCDVCAKAEVEKLKGAATE